MAGETEEVIEDALLPAGHEEVEGLDVAFSDARDEVRVFDRPKDQTLAPLRKTLGAGKKSLGVLGVRAGI
jgi:hypothetical protein